MFVTLLQMAFLWGCYGAAQAVTPMVAAGDMHSVMLNSSGTVFLAGDDSHGQLGQGRLTLSTIPLRVTGLTSARRNGANMG